MSRLAAGVFFLSLAVPGLSQDVTEPKSGATFAAKDGGLSLLGVGLRTKSIAKVKVYAIGLYVADSALSGPLEGKAGTPELYRELVSGDFNALISWTPGVGLETKTAGLNKPPLNDKAFASAVFSIWLGDRPIQDDVKKDLVSRAAELLR